MVVANNTPNLDCVLSSLSCITVMITNWPNIQKRINTTAGNIILICFEILYIELDYYSHSFNFLKCIAAYCRSTVNHNHYKLMRPSAYGALGFSLAII